MKRTVRLREETDQDLTAAASWYEQQRVGLGHEFLDEALTRFELMAKNPWRSSSATGSRGSSCWEPSAEVLRKSSYKQSTNLSMRGRRNDAGSPLCSDHAPTQS